MWAGLSLKPLIMQPLTQPLFHPGHFSLLVFFGIFFYLLKKIYCFFLNMIGK